MREESRAKGMGVVMAREALMGEETAALPRGFTAPLMALMEGATTGMTGGSRGHLSVSG